MGVGEDIACFVNCDNKPYKKKPFTCVIEVVEGHANALFTTAIALVKPN